MWTCVCLRAHVPIALKWLSAPSFSSRPLASSAGWASQPGQSLGVGGLGALSSSHSSLPSPGKCCKIQTKQGRAEETTLPNILTFPGVM